MTLADAFEIYIKTDDKFWLEKFAPYIIRADTLKIGNGFGYLSELIRAHTSSLSIIDIVIQPKTINKNKVQIYNGFRIPYPDKSFDTTIIVFTLHHIPQSRDYFHEIMRVTRKRIILLEETYNNLFQKTHIYYRDWMVNKKAEQLCKLYWNSYFSRKDLNNLIKNNNLKEVYKFTKKHKSYFKELFVLDIFWGKSEQDKQIAN